MIEEHIGIAKHLFGLGSTDRVILLGGLQDAIINTIDLFIIHILILITQPVDLSAGNKQYRCDGEYPNDLNPLFHNCSFLVSLRKTFI